MAVQPVLVPAGRLRCFITGRLRRETPEEHVRQRVARSLVEEYGYAKSDIALEYRINMGRAKKGVDIAIFQHEKPHLQENILTIAETKRDKVKPTDRENGIGQLHSYLAACPNAKWGLWVGSELQAYEVVESGGERKTVEVADIPPYGKTQPPRITFDQLVPADSLREVFQRCHNYIYANQGLPKDQAFHELLKLIFCKMHDERLTLGEMRFDLTSEERRSEIAQRRLRTRVANLFAEVKERYEYIFDESDQIQLDNRVLGYIVSELRRYSLLNTPTDIKGEAYQEIVRANLRGARGEFFTPPNVCQMAVEMVFALFPRERWMSLRLIDPAAGTGGFVRAAMNFWRDHIYVQQHRKWKLRERAFVETENLLRDVCTRCLYGIDINPVLVRAAQMNLVMHGDGSTNAYQDNSLLPPGEWHEDLNRNVRLGTFDIVLTNPPFGSGEGLIVDDQHILDQFELSSFEASTLRLAMPPEQLFIERCYQLLKPGGVMAIVLPDSILSNPGLLHIRRWILQRCRIIASVDLPVETFVAFGGTGTQTSVLVLQKKTEEEMRVERAVGQSQDYEIFMALCETMGYDRRGNERWLRTPEGEVIEKDESYTVIRREPDGILHMESKNSRQRVRDDDVAKVSELFQEWLEQHL